MNPIGLLLCIPSFLFLGAAIFNWNWFFHLVDRRGGLIAMLGRTAQRVLYAVIGVALIGVGIFITFFTQGN